MIKVNSVTKKYPARLAVDDISFEVSKGEIVGFLGPNGAGKSTTMRMIAAYLPMDSGTIEVAGFDVATQSREVRRRVGYLPESCPLYADMRVDEYLHFRAELKGVNRYIRKTRVNDVKEQCGLTEVGKRIIGQLSKGYRQRVGLADSLVHDPDLLILDEPTVGLDPFQIRQMRDLIRQLAEEHTILLSTHIMQEVEATCQRIMIICDGCIVASDTEANLHRMLQQKTVVEMEVLTSKEEFEEKLKQINGAELRMVSEQPHGWIWVEVETLSPDMRVDLFKLAVEQGWTLRELKEQPHSLEDIFVQIATGEGATL
ncbi:MAG: ATP-binding cassette domain-containing protein [Lentisphaerae bacterium]|nr:ATP-binding cassette domain-containing protein [Lentisphaerota bacterium]